MSSSTESVPSIPLRGGEEIPQLGFGVFQVPPTDTAEVTTRALMAGYRHIDTAAAYRNEAGVGQAVRASGLPREEVFITTKCFNDDHGFEQAKRALRASLDRLEMRARGPLPDPLARALAGQVRGDLAGVDRAAGGGPGTVDRRVELPAAHLERVISETGVTPAVNQVELHPRFQQAGLRREHEELGIVTEAWSPLAQGAVLDDPVIGRSPRTTTGRPARW